MATAIETLVPLGTRLASELESLAQQVRAGVVQVHNGRGGGAGTIWSADGLIVTNHHVVPGDGARVTFAGGRSLRATVIAALPERDLAVLQVEAGGLPALPVGDSTALRVGEIVMAIGHPLGVRDAVSLGIFSGIGPIEQRNSRHMQEALLANIDLRPGNSGGPLVNIRGQVVGINSMVLGRRTALAVPSASVQRLIDGRVRRTLGVQVQAIETPAVLAERYGIQQSGLLLIVGISSDTPAARADLLPGDMILGVDAQTLQEPGDLAWALTGSTLGETATLHILRGGIPRDVVVRF